MYYPLQYIEWSERQQREQGLIHEYPSLPQDELFLHKLVDAVKLNHRIWVHISHETQDNQRHVVYARPFAQELPEPYQESLGRVIAGQKDYPSRLEPEFWIWDGRDFMRRASYSSFMSTLDIARLLLDHYRVEQGYTYELLYTALDADRQKVMIFMRGVDL